TKTTGRTRAAGAALSLAALLLSAATGCTRPARLCATLGIDRSAYGLDLLGDGPVRLWPAVAPVPEAAISAGPRVGVTGAHDVPWRFWITGDQTVSSYRRHVPRARG
ncbi:DNA-3-methyladenine glycosylase, partial [Micromonospora purpureochromogenes]|uniref:DNA-3-methyladenine glycosylase n=1 Tax=Micromonospora purpureochromogenes TaxID=47872 RepID=UPI00332459B6